MNTNRHTPRTRGAIACAIVTLMLTAGAAIAADPSTTAHRFSSKPMISGTVVTVNDRNMVVDTDQGEQVTLEMDSRTMSPRDLGPGMVMRAEFLALDNCRLYAQRIVPVRGGTSTDRLQAYARTRDSQETIERNATAYGGGGGAGGWSQASAASRVTQPQTMGEHSPGAVMKASPATLDYRLSNRAMITGRVVSVNDHRLVVVTDQGQQVGVAMDSRTMVPREVAPGTLLRAEFTQMRDGRYYAKRIYQIDSGVVAREQAYAHTRDSDFVVAQNYSDCGPVSAPMQNTTTSAVAPAQPVITPVAVVTPEPVVAPNPPAPVVPVAETLPQTASHQPLIALLGLLSLGAAGALVIGRRFHGA